MRLTKPTAIAIAALLFTGCDSGPVSPELTADYLPTGGTLDVRCPSPLTIGQSRQCEVWSGTGMYATPMEPNVGDEWYSSAPSVVSAGHWGWITAVSEGTAMVTATWGEHSGHAFVQVSPPPPPPLSVTIAGPDLVGPNEQCVYTARLSGASSASYVWTASGATGFADGDRWQGGGSGGWFTLHVTATSGGQTASASHTVWVMSGYLAGCEVPYPAP